MHNTTMLSLAFATGLLWIASACQANGITASPKTDIKPQTAYKPTAISPVQKDAKIEKRIQTILNHMSLEQKIGQMIQVKIGDASLQEIKEYGIGSVLNGGGQAPNDEANSTAAQWAKYADAMYQASIAEHKGNAKIPIIWGTDAVHGHNNVQNAVLYPHNIGLGATRNPELVRQIAEATALSVAATGIDWNFAPTVAAARDYRWGRTYESFSEDPELVSILGAKVVEGLQGKASTPQFLDQYHVISTAKHFIGDGGTAYGDDQGYTYGTEEELLRLHLPGYITAIEAGVQTIMASYNFWNDTHSHNNKALLTGLLKNQLKFDGIVVSDWQAIPHITGCSLGSCPEAINAGIDVFMIPNAPDWQNFYHNTIEQVKKGAVPLSRIDDAVLRILRVKMRAGLWDKPSPSQRLVAGKNEIIGSDAHRELARQAVRESLVLLKNDGTLPLNPKQTILVAGTGANNLSMQSGGWSISWQGNDNKNEKYMGATSIYQGISRAVTAAGGKAILSETGDTSEPVDAAVVVFGETAYAEMYGDIQNLETLEIERKNKASLKLIKKLKAKGIKVIAVFISGRPMWVNKELNASNSFISAWLPGSEGQGIADVLFLDSNGKTNHDFKGKLSFSWPNRPCDAVLNKGEGKYQPLFPIGYGLTYSDPTTQWSSLNERSKTWAHGCRLGRKIPKVRTVKLNHKNSWNFYAERKDLTRKKIDQEVSIGAITAKPDTSKKGAVSVIWDGSEEGRLDLRNGIDNNEFLNMLANKGAVVFEIKIKALGEAPMKAAMYSSHLGGSTLELNDILGQQPKNQWKTLSIDLRCFSNIRADMNKISIPFGLHSNGEHALSIANVRYVPKKAAKATMSCQGK